MDAKLSGKQRALFRAELLAHRSRSSLNDADYARTVLHVSLNTFKKCIADHDHLVLKQRTLNSIVTNAVISTKTLGGKISAAQSPSEFGGYTKAEYSYLIGRYVLFRRALDNGLEVTRAVLAIEWNESLSCLSFTETRRFNSDGKWRSSEFKGHIYMHAERVLMGLLAIDNGDTRLTLLHIPGRHVAGSVAGVLRTSGVILTHGYPRRFFQPVVSAVTIEALPQNKQTLSENALCVTLVPGQPGYARAAEDLRIAEEHAVVMTALMWRDARK